jgi:hypothetical protein
MRTIRWTRTGKDILVYIALGLPLKNANIQFMIFFFKF